MGRKIEQSIVIKADVQATLSGMNEVVNKLNAGLREGTTKVDLTKGVGLSLSKQINKYKEELGKFSELTKGNKVEFADSTEAIKSGQNLIKTYKEIRRIVGDFDSLSIVDAKKIFPDAFDKRVSDLDKGLEKLSSSLTKLETKNIDLKAAQDEIGRLNTEAEKFKGLMDKEIEAKLNLDQAKSVLEEVNDEIDKIRTKASENITLKIDVANKASNEATEKRNQIWSKLKEKGLQESDFSGSNASTTKFKGMSATAWEKQATKKDGSEASKAEAKAALEAIKVYNQEKGILLELGEIIEQRTTEVNQLTKALSKVGKMDLPEAVQVSGGSKEEIEGANLALQMREQALEAASDAQAKYNVASTQAKGAEKSYRSTNAAIEEQKTKIDKLTIDINELNKEVGTAELEKAFKTAGIVDFNVEMLKSQDGIRTLRMALGELDQEKLDALKKELLDMGVASETVEEALRGVRTVVNQVDQGAEDIKKTASEIENLKNQVLQFFSLTNAVQLFKRAVTSALNTVKELDETMTEAAVVTEFDVGDMWNKLPQYSAEAQKLGVSINGMYQATTLYYQQGLKTNEAMQIGVETMKMAKIASMDSTEATKAMTAALRGFNMELNETSATRVNDVYSQLAAVTAADTNQIATAMEKTASIAASANMEFETTAALLAQIIETTQEAPETAGTAMKTIIARFAEVKELKNQGQMTGKDSEGEDIDVNKIQTALRSVGISMDDFFKGTEGLHSVLLKLSAKWGDLDFETQRYIATMAAGSRQQSRFIAMMSDYQRTTELVSEAQNSAGASQKQFEKTQDSLKSSLTKLKNAWNEFLMGLANNKILKGAVDTLTFVLETINKLIDGISGGNGLVKSITSLMSVIGALKLGKKVFEGDKFGGFIGKITGKGQGTTEVIDRKTTDVNGNTIEEHIVRNPQQQGEQAGEKAGIGFVAGFNRAVEANKNGEKGAGNFMKNMFTNGTVDVEGKTVTKRIRKKYEKKAGVELQEKYSEQGTKVKGTKKERNAQFNQVKDNYLAEIKEMNPKMTAEQLEAVNKAYMDAAGGATNYQKGIEAANKEVLNLNGTLMSQDAQQQMTAEQLKKTTLDFNAMGQAAMGAGALIGALGALFSSLGMDEAAEATSKVASVFMGLGAVMSTLSAIAPILGMSFTTAGVQITVAGVTAQLAWWWVFLIIAALATLIALAVSFAKKSAENKLENRMAAAAEATKRANEEAQKAKESYDNLLSEKNEYTTLQETLAGLIEGTQEWKQTLIEANNQVLTLLSTYPELAKYVSRGVDGQLIIEDAGWEAVLIAQEEALKNAQMAAGASRVTEARLKKEAGLARLRSGLSEGALSSDDGTIKQKTNNVLRAYEEYGTDIFKEGTEAFNKLNTLMSGIDDETMTDADLKAIADEKERVLQYKQDEQRYKNEVEAQSRASLMAASSEETSKYKYGDDIITAFSTAMSSEGYEAQRKEKKEDINKGRQNLQNNDYIKEIMEKYNIDEADLSGKRRKKKRIQDLKVIYAGMKGITTDEVGELTEAELANAITTLEQANSHSNNLEDFRFRMENNLEDEQQKQLSIMLGGDTSKLTLEEVSSMEKVNLEELASQMKYKSTSDMAEAMGYHAVNLSELDIEDQRAYFESLGGQEATGMDFATYVSENENKQISASKQAEIDLNQNQEKIEKAKTDAIAQLEAVGIQNVEKTLGDRTLSALQGLSQQATNMGEEDAKKYVNSWIKITKSSNLNADQQKELETYLADVDWSNMTEASEAMTYMQELGLDSSEIQTFWEVATDGANAYVASVGEAATITSNFQNQVKKQSEALERLLNGEGTAADLEMVQAAGIDLTKSLQLTAEGWKITEEAAEEARKAMQKQSAEQAKFELQAHKDTIAETEQILKNEDSGLGSVAILDDKTGKYELNTEGITKDNVGQIAEQLGLQQGDEEKDEAFLNRVREEAQNRINGYNNREETTWMLEQKEAFASAAYYSTDEAVAEGNSDEQVRYSMMNEAAAAGLDSSEVVAYSDALKEAYGLEQKVADRIAIDNFKMNQGVQELTDNYENWATAIDQGPGNPQYATAIKGLRSSAEKLLGTTKGLSDEWLTNEKNMKLFNRAANGDKDAIVELQKEASKEILLGAKFAEDGIDSMEQEVIDLVNEFDPGDFRIGMSLDSSEYGREMAAMIERTATSAEAMNAALEAIGFEPDIDWIPVESASLDESTMTYTYTDEAGNPHTVKAESAAMHGGVMSIPIINGSKTSYDGPPDVTVNSDVGNKGGGGSKYENKHDKLHNPLEEINDLMREREKLERRYQRLQNQNLATAKEIADITKKNIANYQAEIDKQNYIKKGREQQIQEEMAKNPELQKFVYTETGVDGKQSIRINWEAFEALRDSDQGEKADEYYDKILEWLQSIYDAEVAIEEAQDAIYEEQQKGKDDYVSFEDQVKEAVIADRQKEIDKLSEINDSINDTNSRILDSMQQQIDEYRQNRDNEKTEKELEDKQRRLAYLQQDTSGANALEILNLQKEIEEGQESYTDQLIDQKISELQQQNDQAAEQRQQQIDIMQAQLDYAVDNGLLWDEVSRLIENGTDAVGGLVKGSELETLLQKEAGFEGLSKIGQMAWLNETNNMIANGLSWRETGSLSTFKKEGESVTFTNKEGKTVTGTIGKNNEVITKDGSIYTDVGMDARGNFVSEQSATDASAERDKRKQNEEEEKKKGSGNLASLPGQYLQNGEQVKTLQRGLNELLDHGKLSGFEKLVVDGDYGKKTKGAVAILQTAIDESPVDGLWGSSTKTTFSNSDLKQYKTGGLADFTGPAWLDGTKSKPEYILNSDQTKAFFMLVDVLSSLQVKPAQSTQNTGDSTYDIDINVESIGSDYDVEQMAAKIKSLINEDARYRNNNAINLMR